jgi:endonuclease YncB( thermonuclease family)
MSNKSILLDLYKETLLTKNKKNTSYFTIDGYFTVKCISVYDGDTINVVFNPFGIDSEQICRFRIRLMGIDTPEIKNKNLKEKEKAILVREYLRGLILNKLIYIKCEGFDKYGRLLAYIYDESYSLINEKGKQFDKMLNSINQILIDKDYAYSYCGGKKNLDNILFKITN